MPMLEEVGLFLQTLGLGTLGDTLYLSRLMDAGVPDFAAALFEAPGQQGQRTHDIEGLSLVRPLLEVLVRGGSAQYAATSARALAIHQALAAVVNQTLSGVRYLSIDPLAPPQDMGADAHNRPVIELRFLVTKDPILREGVVASEIGEPSGAPYLTLSGIPVFWTIIGDPASLRTATGLAVYLSEPGDGWATPAHT